MIITCPACRTQYAIDADALGSGKNVRCAHCGHQWHQVPVEEQPVQPAYASAAQAAFAPMPQPQPAPMPQPQPMPEPEPVPEPQDIGVADPDTLAEAIAEVISEPAGDLDEAVEEIVEAVTNEPAEEPPVEEAPVEEMPVEEPAEEPAPEPEEEASLSDEEINEMLGPEEEVDEVASLVDGQKDEQTEFDPDDLPEEEPIPEVFTARDMIDGDDEIEGGSGRGRMLLMVLGIAVVVIGGLGAGLYFARDPIVSVWSGAASLYEMVGIEVGPGIELQDVRKEWVGQDQNKQFVVSGTIVNVSNRTQPVPLVKIEFRDEDQEVVQTFTYPPEVADLPAGQRVEFEAQVGELVRTARYVHVMFSDEIPETLGQGGAHQ